ncbi:MAG: type II toxin-antitoxin system Phd/YefM family antitoxin [Terrimicrobiaceae bacterium]|jgi:prevent-host-death family protein
MLTLSANEAKQSLGRILDAVQQGPVMIRKHNREAAVVMSPAEYDRLRGFNVAEFSVFCERIGKRARKAGLTERKLAALVAEK